MSIATRACNSLCIVLTAVIIAAMLAIAPPARAQDADCPEMCHMGGNGGAPCCDGVTVDINNQTAASSGGDGGNGGIGVNIVALNCFLLLVDCGTAGPLGGGDAFGGNGAPSFAFNV